MSVVRFERALDRASTYFFVILGLAVAASTLALGA